MLYKIQKHNRIWTDNVNVLQSEKSENFDKKLEQLFFEVHDIIEFFCTKAARY